MKYEIANAVHFRRLPRRSMEQRVTDLLRELIVTGELAEGTPLVQRDLAHRMGVSQTPIRVGLSELARDGLVEVTGTGRSLVSRLTREDLEEIYAARLGLEGLAARAGAPALDDEGYDEMRVRMRELEQIARRRDVEAYLRARWDFHAICYRASGRTRLVAEVERLFWRAGSYHRRRLSTGPRRAGAVGSFRALLHVGEARDGGPRSDAVAAVPSR